MKNLQLISAVALATMIMLSGVSTVRANGSQEQELKTKAEVKCTSTGAYGQNVECDAKAEAEGKQKQVFRKDGTPVKMHDTQEAPATALDTASMAVAAGTIVSGAGAFIIKRKIA